MLRHKIIAGVVFGCLLLSLGLAGTAAADTTDGNVTVTTLDAGQANAQIIETPEQTIIYDTGTYTDAGAPIIDYLQAESITNISMVISHSDSDHVGGAAEIINHIENSTSGSVNAVYEGGTTSTTATYTDFVTQVENNNITRTTVTEGDVIPTSHPNTSITVLGPPNDEEPVDSRPNDFSVVLRLDYSAVEWILSGDLSKEYETQIITDFDLSTLNVESLTVGHHGADTSTTSTWLQALNPDIAVISAPNSSTYNHPEQAVLSRIETEIPNDTPETVYTGKHGTVIETSNGEDLSVLTQFNRTTNATVIKSAPRQDNSISPTNLTETVTIATVDTETEADTAPVLLPAPTDDGPTLPAGAIPAVAVAIGLLGIIALRRD